MIFTGIEALFFLLGVISTLAVLIVLQLNRQYKFNIPMWICFTFGAALSIFCIAWSLSSILEGEQRAGSMGLIFFGLPALLFLLNGFRLMKKRV